MVTGDLHYWVLDRSNLHNQVLDCGLHNQVLRSHNSSLPLSTKKINEEEYSEGDDMGRASASWTICPCWTCNPRNMTGPLDLLLKDHSYRRDASYSDLEANDR